MNEFFFVKTHFSICCKKSRSRRMYVRIYISRDIYWLFFSLRKVDCENFSYRKKKMIINFSSQDFSAECFFTRIYEKNKRYSSMFLNIVQKKRAVHVLVSKWSVKCLNLRTSRNVWFCRDWKGFFRVLLW